MFLDEMAAGEPQRPWPKWLIHIPTIYHEFDFSRRQRQSSDFVGNIWQSACQMFPVDFAKRSPDILGKSSSIASVTAVTSFDGACMRNCTCTGV